jgi:uncharacterized membrane protein YbaN (DUF454 family)
MHVDPTGVVETSGAAGRDSLGRNGALPEIELDDRSGRLRVSDPRLFHPGRRAFAGQLVESLGECPGVRKVEVDLASTTCRVDFDDVSSHTAVMVGMFVDAVREATSWEERPWWRVGPRWSTLTAFRFQGDISRWETHEDRPGRFRLINRGIDGDRDSCSRLADRVSGLEGVGRCHVSPRSRQITVDCEPGDASSASRTLDRVERILDGRKASRHREASLAMIAQNPTSVVPIATGWRRLRYLAMAGGAFTMTIVGVVVPGIPTVPFLLATSYYLARSSRHLDDWLQRTAFFGPVLQEWEAHAALSLVSKGKMIGMTATIIVLTVVFMPLTPVAVVVILLLSSMSVSGILRMPTLSGDPPAARTAIGATLALPAS